MTSERISVPKRSVSDSKMSVNSELLKRSMIDPNRSVNNSKRSVNSTK